MLFGSIISAYFCNVFTSRRSTLIFWCSVAATLLLQGCLSTYFGTEFLRYIYPLVTHLPLTLVLWLLTGKALWSLVSVLCAYLCCQLRLWLALLVTKLMNGDAMLQCIAELVITVPLLLVLLYFVSPSVRRLGERSFKGQYLFGVIPALYYVFDYVTVVYTDMLIKGDRLIAELMPFICCVAYLLFLLFYSVEEQKHIQLQQAQKTLDIQLKQSVREIEVLQESQQMAKRYRHDLRHHLRYISSCISNGQYDQAQSYISGIYKEIEAQRVEHYCENEAINLILSAFAERARKDSVQLSVRSSLSDSVNVSDTDLCVLLSNALENAVNACRGPSVSDAPPVVDVQLYMRNGKLFLQITNPCSNDVFFENGIPVSDKVGHGIGVQSICAIVEKHHGVYSFSVKDGQFTLRLSI